MFCRKKRSYRFGTTCKRVKRRMNCHFWINCPFNLLLILCLFIFRIFFFLPFPDNINHIYPKPWFTFRIQLHMHYCSKTVGSLSFYFYVLIDWLREREEEREREREREGENLWLSFSEDTVNWSKVKVKTNNVAKDLFQIHACKLYIHQSILKKVSQLLQTLISVKLI